METKEQQILMAETEVKDATEAYENAKHETHKAYEWEQKMLGNLEQAQKALSDLKEF